ncbi:hypothetical protein MATL_G00145170 [Megalops atlanticus]|uniref:Ig-like domain-containing protein n=1 Tax=Megalops atlanticus TaxID=7932 RepID=A0A9D3PWL1_MEGAT|nr:hypothetical protein MATL_G00145170 [Megalops atlanticus]
MNRCCRTSWGTPMALLRILCLLVFPSVSSSASSPVRVKIGGSALLRCDVSAYRDVPDDQLDVLWQTHEGEEVARFFRGAVSIGVNFVDRAEVSIMNIRQGNFFLTINPIVYNDEDTYECVWSKGHSNEKLLVSVRLGVLASSLPESVSMSFGDPVTLPCYSHINRKIASVSLERIRQGDISLTLRGTRLSDSGVYQCYTDQSQSLSSLTLHVLVPPQTISIRVTGMSFSLRVPHVPVDVYFSREAQDKGVYTVVQTSSNMTIEKVTLWIMPGPPQGFYMFVLVVSVCLILMVMKMGRCWRRSNYLNNIKDYFYAKPSSKWIY